MSSNLKKFSSLSAFGAAKIVIALVLVALVVATYVGVAYAETYPGGTDNGKTSRIKQVSGDLVTLGHGSTSNTPDWGADWNRIVTASKWKPQGDIGPSDVKVGKKFYNSNRNEQTGTLETAGPCPTQAWSDGVAQSNASPATREQAMINNCVSNWPVANPAVVGDEKHDPVTGLTWSQCLKNTSGTIIFTTSSCSYFSWDNSQVNNVGRSAAELCSERGNGWRLPTQKEFLQAFIDGSYFNLTNLSSSYWSATQAALSVSVLSVRMDTGGVGFSGSGNNNWVRCVR